MRSIRPFTDHRMQARHISRQLDELGVKENCAVCNE
jgi:hypothetical protein